MERRHAAKNKVCAVQTKNLIFLYRGNGMWCECGILIAKKPNPGKLFAQYHFLSKLFSERSQQIKNAAL